MEAQLIENANTTTVTVSQEIDNTYGPQLDPYKKGKSMFMYPLLSDYERICLVDVNRKIADFENVIKKSILMKSQTFCNGLIIQGGPGSGKTYNSIKWLGELVDQGVIRMFQKVSGKLSPITLFQALNDTREEDQVLLLDDTDVFTNRESQNLLKAAFETKSENPREVSYGTRGNINTFLYESFCIIITNHNFEGNTDEHIKAILDRIHLINLNLTAEDMMLKNTEIVEGFLNKTSTCSNDVKEKVIKFYNTEVKDFFKYGVFEKCNVNFSVRYIMKVIDLQIMFNDNWKTFSIEYQRMLTKLKELKTAELLTESKN